MGRRKKGRAVQVSLPSQLVDDVVDLIARGYYSDLGDFIKEAVRENLRRVSELLEEAGA